MPPQVSRAGDGSSQVIKQTPDGVENKSSSIEKKPTEEKNSKSIRASQDPKVEAKVVQGQKNHATEQKSQQNVNAQIMQRNLQKQLPAEKIGNATPPDPTGLKPGESISAKSVSKQDGIHFEFQRPVTKEQAAAIIFQKGQVPDGAKLVQGAGNSWIVQTPNDINARQNTVRHFNSHQETVITPPRMPTDQTFPEPHVFYTWVGGQPKTGSGSQRLDLKNDMGFTVKNNYQLDEGQRATGTLGHAGTGYEVAFEKPMTKDQVMEKIFDKQKISQGEVRLIPMTPEPSMLWKVEVIGTDALTAFKAKPLQAFTDAAIHGKHSLPAGTPAGVRQHIENQTVPQNAVKHPPDVYVWEQDGHMMYVKTNNKGKDGYYDVQFTKMPDDKQGQIWLNYYMKEKGMEPREAWKNFWNDTVEVTRMQIGMINGAVRAPHVMRIGTPRSSFGDGPSSPRSTPHVTTGRNIPKGSNVDVDIPLNNMSGRSPKNTIADPAPPPKPAPKPNPSGTSHVAEPNISGNRAGKPAETTTTVKSSKSNKSSYEVEEPHTNQKKDLHEEDNVAQSKKAKTSKTDRSSSKPAAETDAELKGLNDELKDLKDIAGDHVAGGKNLGRDLPISTIKQRLKKLAEKGDADAGRLLKDIEEVQEKLQKRARELGLLPPLPQK